MLLISAPDKSEVMLAIVANDHKFLESNPPKNRLSLVYVDQTYYPLLTGPGSVT
mgnify:CR=1 FL=1